MIAVYGFSWKGLALAMGGYYFRMFFVTGAYHRYFSHRTYKTSRWFQFVLAFFAQTTFQKGVLWWAAHHRVHHKLSDKPGDLHSMKLDGFYRSHVGWILDPENDSTDLKKVSDLAKYPELVWLNTYWYVPALMWAVGSYLVGGTFLLTWMMFVSTTLLWHGTFTINSITHWMGRVRYKSGDESKNSLILAIVTMGEGWHNNHHYYQRATNQGFFWWEIDATYYILRLFQAVGLVWDIHVPPAHVRDSNRVDGKGKAPVVVDAPPMSLPSPADAE
jgi:stearoyl-CoA desaturase (delta-9 desaturase)